MFSYSNGITSNLYLYIIEFSEQEFDFIKCELFLGSDFLFEFENGNNNADIKVFSPKLI